MHRQISGVNGDPGPGASKPHRLPPDLLGRIPIKIRLRREALRARLTSARAGVGQLLLLDALRRSLEAAVNIAAMAVLVDAKDEAAETFYRHFSFLPLQQQPRRLFLPMKTIAGLFHD
jgi:hypothetical protein